MALTQRQPQYFSAYSQPDSETQNLQLRREFTQRSVGRKISTLYKGVSTEKQVRAVEEQRLVHTSENSLICDSKMYALKKRLLVPTWLLEGVLLALGTKEPWFESIACSRMGRVFACPSHVNVKTLVPFFLVWHELVSRMFHLNSKETTIKLQINKYISGTKKDIYEISKEIENIFSSPLKLFEIKPAKKSKTFSMSKTGSLNFIRHAQLENDVDGVWLTLNLTNSFQEICYPPELRNSIHLESKNIVSISPIVIQSMGARANLKKILNYLFLEFSKQESYSNNSNWNSFRIDCKKIIPFHKDFLSTAPSFYDHGVLGWNNCAPNKKISDIKKTSKAPHHRHEIICSWQLSDQVKEAYEIENAISEKIIQQTVGCVEILESSLFPEPPEDELKKAREERLFKRVIQEKEQAAKARNTEKKAAIKTESAPKKISKKVVTQTLFDDGIVVKKSSPTISRQAPTRSESFCEVQKKEQPRNLLAANEMADNEFLVLVSEFYESLKPMQKKAFERDRKGMTREQFKAYMSSILQRKKQVQL